jgi:hypothetical protein
MAQGFSSFCATGSCQEHEAEQLEGVWLSPHIRVLLEERDTQLARNGCVGSDVFGNGAMRHIGGQGIVV